MHLKVQQLSTTSHTVIKKYTTVNMALYLEKTRNMPVKVGFRWVIPMSRG